MTKRREERELEGRGRFVEEIYTEEDPEPKTSPDPLGPARGCLNGLALVIGTGVLILVVYAVGRFLADFLAR